MLFIDSNGEFIKKTVSIFIDLLMKKEKSSSKKQVPTEQQSLQLADMFRLLQKKYSQNTFLGISSNVYN